MGIFILGGVVFIVAFVLFKVSAFRKTKPHETWQKIAVVGLMTIPDINSDPKTIFSEMHQINEKLIMDYSYQGELSMGMSNDYEVALDYGATIVRIGTKLFT